MVVVYRNPKNTVCTECKGDSVVLSSLFCMHGFYQSTCCDSTHPECYDITALCLEGFLSILAHLFLLAD